MMHSRNHTNEILGRQQNWIILVSVVEITELFEPKVDHILLINVDFIITPVNFDLYYCLQTFSNAVTT